MIRKVIQLAGKTSVVSLPLAWVKKYGINKGDELELEERGREIVIKVGNAVELDKVTIDVADLDKQSLKWTLSALHKFGYDEIEILYEDPEDLKVLQQMIKDILMGFVIMQQTSKKVVLKSVSNDLESEFDMTLRRSFLVTISLGESLVEKIKNGDAVLDDLISLEQTNNQLTNFCERMLNKKGHKDYRKTCFYYVIIWNLEKVCDQYRDLCEILNGKKVDENFLSLLEKTNFIFKEYYSLFYKFDVKSLVELDTLILELRNHVSSCNLSEEMFCLKGILDRVREFLASTIAINHGK